MNRGCDDEADEEAEEAGQLEEFEEAEEEGGCRLRSEFPNQYYNFPFPEYEKLDDELAILMDLVDSGKKLNEEQSERLKELKSILYPLHLR